MLEKTLRVKWGAEEERQNDTEGMKAQGRQREEAAVQSKCREMRKKNHPNHTSLESANTIANTLHDN